MASKYYVIFNTNHDKFLREVNKYLEDGWECQGGVSENGGMWAQALIQKEPPPQAVKPVERAGGTVKKKRVAKKKVSARSRGG